MRLYVVTALVIWLVIILSLGSLGASPQSVRRAAHLSTTLYYQKGSSALRWRTSNVARMLLRCWHVWLKCHQPVGPVNRGTRHKTTPLMAQ